MRKKEGVVMVKGVFFLTWQLAQLHKGSSSVKAGSIQGQVLSIADQPCWVNTDTVHPLGNT